MAVARFTQSAIEIQNILDAVQDQTIYDPATETADGLESADDKRNLNKLSMTDAEMQTLLSLLESGGQLMLAYSLKLSHRLQISKLLLQTLVMII